MSERGLTVADLAKRYRVSPDKVRTWIRRGELAAINRRDDRCIRPSFVITPEAIEKFEQRRTAATAEPPKPERRRKQSYVIDYFPD